MPSTSLRGSAWWRSCSITFAFVVVLSVFNGFEGLVKSLYSSFYPHVLISPKAGTKTITVSPEQWKQLSAVKDAVSYTAVVEEKTLLLDGDVRAARLVVKGVDSAYTRVTGVADNMIRGEFNTGDACAAFYCTCNGVEGALGVQSDKNIFPLLAYIFKGGAI